MASAVSTCRWVVNISAWQPCEAEIGFLLQLLPEEEADQCRSYKRAEDCKRALASRLLQRQCCCRALGLAWHDVLIKRTRGKKPYCANARIYRSHAPNWNFNTSHEVGEQLPAPRRPIRIAPQCFK